MLSLAACSSADSRLGNAELGIASFRITETATRLELIGLGSYGEELAHVALAHEFVDDTVSAGAGRKLTADFDGERMTYMNVGFGDLVLNPSARRPAIGALLRDPFVAGKLARWGIAISKDDPLPASPELTSLDYGHGGACSSGLSTWAAICNNDGNANNKCCLQHLSRDGFQWEFVVCAGPKNTAERACFAPPSCSAGKAYGTAPVGCDQQAQTECPAGTSSFLAGSKYQCQTANNTSCPNKSVGPLGCAVCDGPDTYTGVVVTTYTGDTCGFDPIQQQLSVTKDGTGSGTVASTSPNGSLNCGSTCTQDFNANINVTLSASAAAGSTFTGWGGACASAGTNSTATVTMSQQRDCTATFTLDQLPNGSACTSDTQCASGNCEDVYSWTCTDATCPTSSCGAGTYGGSCLSCTYWVAVCESSSDPDCACAEVECAAYWECPAPTCGTGSYPYMGSCETCTNWALYCGSSGDPLCACAANWCAAGPW